MSIVINEKILKGKRIFRKGDLVYYDQSDGSMVYGIVDVVEEYKGDYDKIWAYWQVDARSTEFELRENSVLGGSAWMESERCEIEKNKSIVKGWKNIPEFFKF